MIKQNVNIVNFNSLYEILEEIKDNLSFNITKYENDKDFIKKNKDPMNYLIITNPDNNIIKKNVLIFDKLPISLNKLVELININLIKLKFN